MSDSILERIAQWLLAAYGQITLAGGYANTLAVSRPQEEQIDGDTIRDLTAILSQGDPQADAAPTMEHFFWLQPFDLFVFALGRGGTPTPVDQRLNSIVADVHARIGLEIDPAAIRANKGVLCGGLAYRIDVLPWEYAVNQALHATVVRIPVAVAYEVLRKDPYSQ